MIYHYSRLRHSRGELLSPSSEVAWNIILLQGPQRLLGNVHSTVCNLKPPLLDTGKIMSNIIFNTMVEAQMPNNYLGDFSQHPSIGRPWP